MRIVLLSLCLCLVAITASAQGLEADCVAREDCEGDIMAACPEGAVILGERLKPSEGALEPAFTRLIRYACGTASVGSSPAPGPEDARTALVAARERARPGQIRLLQEQRSEVRVAGPVFLTLVGAGLTTSAWTYAVLTDDKTERRSLLVASVFPATLILLPGVVWLTKSVRQRRALQDQIDALSSHRASLAPSFALSRGEVRAGLSLSF